MEKQFLDFLGSSRHDRIRCAFGTQQGKVAKIMVVQYETLLHGKWLAVVRYDTAHGFFHRDVYYSAGRKQFKELVHLSNLADALTYAIQDIRSNWEIYKSTFVEQENDKEKLKKK